jgi:DNA-binding HxlR family transcriptional regulator
VDWWYNRAMTDAPRGYGQYCPIVRAVEVLGERWSMLIIRDLIVGTHRFNDLARGLPGLSRSLLSRRLRQLEAAGIVRKVDGDYRLTPAGQELEPIVFGLGEWGARWAFGEPRREECDPRLLLWWMHERLDRSALPDRRIVLAFVLSEPRFYAWLVVDDPGVSICASDPGFDVDATIRAPVAALSEVWLGRHDLVRAVADGSVVVEGSRGVVDALPNALQLSPAAPLVQAAR